MNERIPEPLKAVIEQLTRLPGLGPKSAMRMAMTLLKWPASETKRLGQAIHDLRDSLHLCTLCGGLTACDPCTICADVRRTKNTLCVVSEWDSMLTLDEGGFYLGQYFILGGLLSPINNVHTDTLDFERLIKRLKDVEIKEIILALGSTIEAENTASYIRNLITAQFNHIKVTRLAQGIPLGAEVKFMDKETLRQSLEHRQQL